MDKMKIFFNSGTPTVAYTYSANEKYECHCGYKISKQVSFFVKKDVQIQLKSKTTG